MSISLGLAILSWRSPLTLLNSLSSHVEAGLFDAVDETSLFLAEGHFVEPSKLPKHESLTVTTSEKNLGIHRGAWAAARELKTDLLLFLENDMESVLAREQMRQCLERAKQEIADGADVVHLRSRYLPGPDFVGIEKYMKYNRIVDPLETEFPGPFGRFRPLLSIIRPNKRREHLSAAPFIEKQPDKIHRQISRTHLGNFRMDSEYAPWTNQPLLIRRSDFLNLMDWVAKNPSHKQPAQFQTIETALRAGGWKGESKTVVVMEKGAFRHTRLDR